MRRLGAAVGMGALLEAPADGHSWAACTDYRGSPNHFEQEKCFGWPRNWEDRYYNTDLIADGHQIAVDTGRDHRPGLREACDVPMAMPDFRRSYSAKFPHAVYEQGRVYCIAWPMKHHAAASCTSADIPDMSLTLMVSSMNPTSDPTQREFNMRNVNELAGFATRCNPDATKSNYKRDECQLGLEKHQPGQQDCKGFQRSPLFCDSPGSSMGSGCFKVPEDMSEGHYVGQWLWEFQPNEVYASCFDFRVVPPGSAEAIPGPTGTAGDADTRYLPCVNNMVRFSGPKEVPPPLTASPAPTPAAEAGAAGTCPIKGFGLPLSVGDCYCGLAGPDGAGCEASPDDGSACWCQCCCHFVANRSCSYHTSELAPYAAPVALALAAASGLGVAAVILAVLYLVAAAAPTVRLRRAPTTQSRLIGPTSSHARPRP